MRPRTSLTLPNPPTLVHTCNSAAVGSEPVDSTNSSGLVADDSRYEPAKSNGGGSVKRAPSVAETKPCSAGTTLSGRSMRSTSTWGGGGEGTSGDLLRGRLREELRGSSACLVAFTAAQSPHLLKRREPPAIAQGQLRFLGINLHREGGGRGEIDPTDPIDPMDPNVEGQLCFLEVNMCKGRWMSRNRFGRSQIR